MKCKCCGYSEAVPNDGKWRLCPKCQTINDNSRVCPVCEGDGSKECDVETTTGTVKQYDGPCDRCGGTGLVKPSASVQPLNAAMSDRADSAGQIVK